MSSRRLPRIAGFLAAAAMVGTACGGTSDSSDTAQAPGTAPESVPVEVDGAAGDTPVGAVPDIMAFSGPLVGGGRIDGAELADKPTAFWFWSPT